MIKVAAVRDIDEKFIGMEVSGHAGFADYGKDIVCAGVSALVETCILALENIGGFAPRVLKEEGFLSLEIPGGIPAASRQKADIIIETVLLGLKDISKSYPKHIQVKIKRRCDR